MGRWDRYEARLSTAAAAHATPLPNAALRRTRHARRRTRPRPHRQQRALAARVIADDDAEWLPAGREGKLQELRLIAGLDISFAGGGGAAETEGCETEGAAAASNAAEAGGSGADTGLGSSGGRAPGTGGGRAVAALAALNFPGLELVHLELMECDLDTPYVPGFLGFRWVSQVPLHRCPKPAASMLCLDTMV